MAKIQTLQDNRLTIGGKEAQALNEALKEYIMLDALIKDKTKTLNKLKEQIKSCGVGSFETNNFTFDIIEVKGHLKTDDKKLAEKYPEIFADEDIKTMTASSIKLSSVKAKV